MTPEEVLEAARARGWMLATAESCTGGLIAGALTGVAGSSDVVDRGFVTYSNRSKMDMLGVKPLILETYGAVSEPVAREMAEGALQRSAADVTVSVTGIAGPGGGSAEKPVGMVCFGLARNDGETTTETVQFGDIGRREVRDATVDHALTLLARAASGP